MKSAITQAEIAQMLGVNQATVSCAFTDSPKVSPELRERIRSTALRMGYRPNASSRAIRNGKTDTLAVLLSTDGHRSYMPLSLQDAILYEAERHNKLVIFSRFSDVKLTSEELMPRVLFELSADGLLLNYSHMVPATLDELIKRYRIPAIWINRNLPFDCVYPNDSEGTAMAVRRLFEMGHRRIAFLHSFPTPPPAQEPHSVIQRQDGYLKGMNECGLTPMPIGIMSSKHNEKRQSFNTWWDSFGKDHPTAVIGYQQPDAAFFLLQLSFKGLRVPNDVSFVMYGDHQDKSFGIQLDNIILPEGELGRRSVEMLIRKIDSPWDQIPSCITMPVWEPGESCRPIESPGGNKRTQNKKSKQI
ncbi:MAG TPA: hypothetical protein DCZ94_18065 [Lentisphaeria bacterium]|nr:MAG: hypothetical protein A2X48_00740 [Lentisphaerae bacterium GWF2_49_21]HBC88852.1 hypothetical protein [Lentisphaeria bacterium]